METICMEEDVKINPDEFLNLDEFLPHALVSENIKMETTATHPMAFSNQILPHQLTPPISPQPNHSVIIDSSLYQKVRLIPVTLLQTQHEQQQPLRDIKKIIAIVPKPSSSSDSDSNPQNTHHVKASQSPVDKALIKQQRQIRNREAAIISRIKKKQYVETLEAENKMLVKENSILKAENSHLKLRLKSYSAMTCQSARSISAKLPTKNATLMLAVIFMIGFNVMPVKNLLFKSSFKEPIATQHFHSRQLLTIRNSTNATSENDSSETTEAEQPIYFNQTDHIRKVNIANIRRWIPEPDLLNISYIKQDFDFNPDPLQEKLAKMYEKSREQSQKHMKTKKRIPKKKPTMEPMQLYNSDLNIIKLNEFFDEINRKDDTFYVFSFKADHLLLPANDNSYNFSQIKMNLIMPRNNSE